MKYDVIITAVERAKRPQIMTVILRYNPMGLRKAKDIVDAPPSAILNAVEKGQAEKVKHELEEAGATVELKES